MLELSDITLSTAYHTSRADFYRNGGKLGGGPRGATGAPVSRRTSHCIHTRRRITAPRSAPRTPGPVTASITAGAPGAPERPGSAGLQTGTAGRRPADVVSLSAVMNREPGATGPAGVVPCAARSAAVPV